MQRLELLLMGWADIILGVLVIGALALVYIVWTGLVINPPRSPK